MPEAAAVVPGLRGVEYVALAGELYGMPRREASRRAHEVLTYLDLEDARYRRLEEYSTGMKQRLKLAAGAGPRPAACCCSTSRPAAWTRPAATPCSRLLVGDATTASR